MKVITVIGEENSGKTPLITQIFKGIHCSNDASVLYYKTEGDNNNDFKALVEYKNKKIAFCSIGDPADINKNNNNYKHLPSEYILSGLIFASQNEADVLINAYSKPFSEFPENTYKKIVGKSNDYVSKNISEGFDKIKQEILEIIES